MSLHATPVLYLNMGGEMLYVLRQRLKAQRISVDKTIQVLDDVTTALLNPKILSCIFEEKPLANIAFLRSTLECVVLSSIMKLDKNSMNKLFDLMIMMVKYQLTAATNSIEVILLTLNHTDAMRDMVSHPDAQKCVGFIHQMVVDFYGALTFEEIWHARNNCLKELEPYCIRVSILLRLGLQNEDGSFNVTSHKYDEKYEKNKDRLCGLKLCNVDIKIYCNGSFNFCGERDTILGKDMYLHDISKLTSEQENDYLKDCGTRAEFGMLAVQLGTEQTSYQRPFNLNLLSNEDNSNTSIEEDVLTKEDNQDNTIIKYEKTKFNEDYKTKLDNIRADLCEDEDEEINHNLDLLKLLDKIE